MKTWKLVSGILSIVLSIFVMFQSSAAGLLNALDGGKESSGTAGLFVAFLMIAGGIVSIAVRKKISNGGNIALIVIFGLAALIGFVSAAGKFKDLYFWASWCLLLAVLAIICIIKNRNNTPNDMVNEDSSKS
ncbi:hypothetical protein GCWU000322_00744 [Eubacterium saphenum ATCC 49989]|nr:hypothetical protein GCWU000322_00744 [Eubacterium saphenum ATCC 49989]